MNIFGFSEKIQVILIKLNDFYLLSQNPPHPLPCISPAPPPSPRYTHTLMCIMNCFRWIWKSSGTVSETRENQIK